MYIVKTVRTVISLRDLHDIPHIGVRDTEVVYIIYLLIDQFDFILHIYGDILPSPTCKIYYINMRGNYVNICHLNYVACQHNHDAC